jgi:gamma-glutamyltranspeptidase/glutathione hydrolase/leukotriene-C4 hydrolase
MDGKDEWLSVFRPNQSPMLVEGDFISRHNYSLALSAVAEHGPSVFYGHPDGKDDSGNGDAWIAKNMIETIKKSGGIMTREDLRDYKVRVYEPLKTVYNGNTIWTTDAPSCGMSVTCCLWSISRAESVYRLISACRTGHAWNVQHSRIIRSS